MREEPRMENVMASTNVVLFMAVILDAAIAALACDWHRSVSHRNLCVIGKPTATAEIVACA